MIAPPMQRTFRILALDGGGAKGFYTLGVLHELEALLGAGPLSEKFALIFGTSTGAIIATLLALGKSVNEVHELYRAHVVKVMGSSSRRKRTAALEQLCKEVFGAQRFDAFKTGVGIVAVRWRDRRPMIFKNRAAQAHGMHASFVPGFGCSISDAVVASCSAYPFFERKFVTTSTGSRVELMDGGFCANNPTLYAMADALAALEVPREALRVISVGVGSYPEPRRRWLRRVIGNLALVQLLQRTLDANAHSMEKLTRLLFDDVRMVRVSNIYETADMATDLLESDLQKLAALYDCGRGSVGDKEQELQDSLLG